MAIMLDGARVLIGNMRVECAAQSDIDHLAAPANPQQWLSHVNRQSDEIDFHFIPLDLIRFHQGVWIAIEARRINIHTTTEKDTIQS